MEEFENLSDDFAACRTISTWFVGRSENVGERFTNHSELDLIVGNRSIVLTYNFYQQMSVFPRVGSYFSVFFKNSAKATEGHKN